LGGRGREIFDFDATLVYRVSSWLTRAIQINPDLKKKKRENEKEIWNIIENKTDVYIWPPYAPIY
jgi:phosphoglycolate phosphatase-like HAD superfamily hydrolase